MNTWSVSAFDARGHTLQQVVAVEGLVGDASPGSKRGRPVQHEGRRAGVGGEREDAYSNFCKRSITSSMPLYKTWVRNFARLFISSTWAEPLSKIVQINNHHELPASAFRFRGPVKVVESVFICTIFSKTQRAMHEATKGTSPNSGPINKGL